MLNFLERISQHGRKPGAGLYGALARLVLKQNKPLDKCAVDLLKLKPQNNVMHVGFGVGDGIKLALDGGLRTGTGRIYGVDFSEIMCQRARRRFGNDISNGKLVILNEDVAKISLPDSSVDKVFHTIFFYFWPDLIGTCKELKRIMRPGGQMVMVTNPYKIVKYLQYDIMKYAHHFSHQDYIDALSESGFSNIDVKMIGKGNHRDFCAVSCTKKE